ncbi:protein IQ-DOMAIN 31-like isoform X4 [Telopea speciosissima]|uniref:protein IQ-DOMAIN 31-like isoform X4 n=1 Tax=Telopea speciosissima TaxID=54955 RepID=UPI001CC7B51F|nr:protein IQ-DOMAIN 31-like isoform X4 [Telopea speciosissima]
MGKSPGKWIKTLLFGKKASKSSLSKGREVLQTANENGSWVAAKASGVEAAVDPPLISHVTPGTTDGNGGNSTLEKGVPSNLQCDAEVLPGNQDPDSHRTAGPEAANDPERVRQEQAATKAQAAFRGYLEAKHLEPIRVNIDRRTEKLLASAFNSKLLASISTAMPVRLQYGPGEPNSAWNWLERWTSTHFWGPLPQAKKSADAKPQARQRYHQSADSEPGRSKRSVRKVPAANVDNGSIHSTSESEKPKRGQRKVTSHPVESAQEHPQIELEKVKRTLRKVSTSTAEASDRVEAEIEKPKRVLRKVSSPAAADTSDQGMGNSSEKIRKDPIVEAPKIPDVEATQTPLTSGEPVENNTVTNHDEGDMPALERSVLGENIPAANGELNSKEDPTSNGNQKSSKRRASFPAKQEYPENGIQNTPTLPSYMAATASAKAKLRAQGSPRFSQDGVEKDGLTRRHSLPSSTNGKLNSLSPRTQRLVHGSGKGGVRDRSLLSSGDGNDKVVQAEWRR